MARLMKNHGALSWADKGIVPQSLSGTTEVLSGAIDRMTADEQGFLSCKIIGTVGAATGSPSSFSVVYKVTHCATSGGTYADYTDPSTNAAASVTISTASSLSQLNVDLSQANRYVKLSATPAFSGGSSPTIPFSGQVSFGGAHKAPPASTTT